MIRGVSVVACGTPMPFGVSVLWLAEPMPFDWVLQHEVLPLSDALVTPGGMGSVMESVDG